jgi:hypothetical protein
MQDLQNAVPTTHQQDEEFKQMENIGLKEMFAGMGSDLTGGKSNTFDAPNPDAIQYTHGGTLGAPEPQPSAELLHNEQPNLEDVLQNIAEQFALLYTVIRKEKLQGNSQAKAQPVEEKSSSNESLQECVSLTLQQADWFKEMVRGIIDDTYDFADYAENAVEHVVEKEVESYFDSSFNPEDHFDFGDAVSDAVDDRLDDVVSDKIDDAVDAYLTNATISISK